MKKKIILIAAALTLSALSACGNPGQAETPAPTPLLSPSPDASVVQTAEPSPSAAIPAPTPSASADPDAAVSDPGTEETPETPKSTPSPVATPVPTPAPTVQSTPQPTTTVSQGATSNAFRVPATAAVGDDYFADAVYIGDSRAENLRLYGGMKCTFLSYIGQSIYHVSTARVETMSTGATTSVYAALEAKQYSKVYINLGMNDFYFGMSVYSSGYRAVVDKIKQLQPNATIYLLTLSPVNEDLAAAAGYSLSNANIERFNQQIRAIAAERQVYYIETSECFPQPDASITWDGLHFTPSASQQFYAYLKTRAIPTASHAPTPEPTATPSATTTPEPAATPEVTPPPDAPSPAITHVPDPTPAASPENTPEPSQNPEENTPSDT